MKYLINIFNGILEAISDIKKYRGNTDGIRGR